jgi:hypothetical protein
VKRALGLLIVLAVAQAFAQTSGESSERTFQAVDLYVDSGSTPLAAYQIEFKSRDGSARIVGVEGGDSDPFRSAPHFDPDAMKQERVIIAAFSLEDPPMLPAGKTRVATIHVALQGGRNPDYVIQLDAAADPGGNAIRASASFEEGKRR